MSMLSAATDFVQALQSIDHYPPSVRDILLHEFQDVLRQPRSRVAAYRPCLLDNIGEFLTLILDLVASLAKTLVEGDRVVRYIEERITQQDSQDELSDLGILEYLDAKRDSLE